MTTASGTRKPPVAETARTPSSRTWIERRLVYTYRAYRFGVHYGRELYVQFLSMNNTPGKPPKAKKEPKA
jgi:hypothetical protein